MGGEAAVVDWVVDRKIVWRKMVPKWEVGTTDRCQGTILQENRGCGFVSSIAHKATPLFSGS